MPRLIDSLTLSLSSTSMRLENLRFSDIPEEIKNRYISQYRDIEIATRVPVVTGSPVIYRNIFRQRHTSGPCQDLDEEYASQILYGSGIEPSLRVVYTIIRYPLSRTAAFRFVLLDSESMTLETILQAYSVAYRMVYEIEDYDTGSKTEYISGTYHRSSSNGRFGIWGHRLNNLTYNGLGVIEEYSNFVICEFGVDS
jgi:hypothetical protein